MIILEFEDVEDFSEVENILNSSESGFRVDSSILSGFSNSGFGRTPRRSTLSDIVTITGEVVSIITFVKTLLEVKKLSSELKSKKETKKNSNGVSVTITNKRGEKISIKDIPTEKLEEIIDTHIK